MASIALKRPERNRCRSKRLIEDAAGIEDVRRFKNQHLSFLLRSRSVLGSSWHDDKVTRPQVDNPIAELDLEMPPPNKEHFIAVVVDVPGKAAQRLDDLHLLAIERCD